MIGPKDYSPIQAARQEQFLDVVSRDEADRRFRAHLKLTPLGFEEVQLGQALGRILVEDLQSPIDVPGFDRSNVDGFALRSEETREAMEETPRVLQLNPEVVLPGQIARCSVESGSATPISTGAMVPRGADAIVMIEHTDFLESRGLSIHRAVAPGENISFAGSDICRGETILRERQLLTSRELGIIAALGMDKVQVYKRPRVAIISTGDEIVPPGTERPEAGVYDSNATILAATVQELGATPHVLGAFQDNEEELNRVFQQALTDQYDVILISGGTSKGAGDLSYRIVSQLTDPGILAHGVALKPGKPICLAVHQGKPVVILPGFPTSAIFTFHEFVAPVIRLLAGSPLESRSEMEASLPMRLNSERGRTEYVLVSLIRGREGLSAYPLGKGSGSVTTFSLADGFISIPAHVEMLELGTIVQVQLISKNLSLADFVAIGSHCIGLDYLLGLMQKHGFSTKQFHAGSQGGLAAAKRGECDLAGIHLFDPQTATYNRPYLTPELELIRGYQRMQGIVFRKDDARFHGCNLEQAVEHAIQDPKCRMVNRNPGSGTRALIDRLLRGKQPPGYMVQTKTHNSVAASILQGRADWGVAIESIATQYDLGFIPIQEESYDFAVPRERMNQPAIQAFRELLESDQVRATLAHMGFLLLL